MAAVLALGPNAVISHRSAAALWGLLPSAAGFIEVSVPGDNGRERRPGIAIHRSHSLIAAVATRRNGIALTKPKRTLRDLHRTVPQPVLRRAVRRALDLRLIESTDLENEDELTRSKLEELMLRLCRRHHLPLPEVNVRVGSYEVDFLWRAGHLIAETDGFRHHGHRAAFEADRERDASLQTLGYRVLRFTYRQVRNEPSQVASALRALLA